MERMTRLLRDGAGVGIHLVLAGDRVLGGSRFSGTTEDKIVLKLNDRQDYSSVGVPTKSAPSDPSPGRGIRTLDLAEAQIAVLSGDLSGAAQGQFLTDLGTALTDREAEVPRERRALRLDVLPGRITYRDALALHTRGGPMRPLVAIGGDTLTSLGPDLADELEGRPGVAAVITDSQVTVDTFRQVLGDIPQDNAVIVVDDAELLMGSDIDADLALLARGGAGNGWGVLAAGNAESLSLSLAGWMGQVKRNRTGRLLSPQNLADGEVIGVRLTRGVVGQAPQPGRGLLHLGDGTPLTVQVPLSGTEV
jgi:S-DNA-T family DNA segregation ATPase FtsK/SpoIIIE